MSHASNAELWKAGHRQHVADQAVRVSGAVKCLRLIKPLIGFDSVIDFGCGIGAWLLAAERLGATSLLGLDGAWVADTETLISKDRIRLVDLSVEQPAFAKEFDLAMSIEVAEHLPETAANGLVESLISASDHVLFSAATPGQGGIGHINEQPLPYWVQKFWERGYVPLEPVRPYIAVDTAIFPWLRQNIVMFVSYDALIRSSALLRHARPVSDFGLNYRPL